MKDQAVQENRAFLGLLPGLSLGCSEMHGISFMCTQETQLGVGLSLIRFG